MALGSDHPGEELSAPATEHARFRNARRRAHSAAGRQLARVALAAADLCPHQAIPRLSSGAPQWQPGVTGSITHTDGLAAAAVCTTRCIRAVGIDVERRRPVRAGFEMHVCTDSERSNNSLDALTRFSAKESIYKTLAPLGIQPLRFHDVTVTADGNQLRFEPTPQCTWSEALSALIGVWMAGNTHVLTLVWLDAANQTPLSGHE